MNVIGIRHEDKYLMERRVALIPSDLRGLIERTGAGIYVQPSAKRVFSDEEFLAAGARLSDDLSEARLIFGVKEMPSSFFEPGKAYVFFSHVIKGQAYNMPMLRSMMEKGCTLIDYEKVADSMGRRLIFFGRFAGLAGMINTLWSLGQRLQAQGMANPFTGIRQAHTYDSLDEARRDISAIGQEIVEHGLPEGITPLTIGFTGYGNVSKGAQEIAALLPVKEIEPKELAGIASRGDLPRNVIYTTVFREEHLAATNDGRAFELQEYYTNPSAYHGTFEQYIPHLSVLVNGMYWDERYPRLITKEYLRRAFSQGEPRLRVIGDITCDPDGSIECTYKGTEIEDPVFVYDPLSDSYVHGFAGRGILDMAVDILPSELPRESSMAFSQALMPFMPALLECDLGRPFNELDLPEPIRKAVILHQGRLTPDFEYIRQYL